MNNKTSLAFFIVLFMLLAQGHLVVAQENPKPLISDAAMAAAQQLFGGPAEEDYYKTDAILVSATGSAKPVFLAPSVATVISKEQIEAIGAATLAEVIETVPGLHVFPSNFNNYRNRWSIRGIDSKTNAQVLFLLNGQQVKNLHGGQRPMRLKLPVSMISRVEVIRGPGSAVHGADAFSGVINVITKDGQEINGTQVGLRGGSFHRKDAWLQHGGNYGGWDLAVGIDLMKSDGDRDRIINSDLQSSLDSAFGTSASLTPGAVNDHYDTINMHVDLSKDDWHFRWWGWSERGGGDVTGIVEALNNESHLEADSMLADLEYQNTDWFDDLTLGARLTYQYHNENTYLQLFPEGSTLPIGADGNVNFVDPVGVTLFTDGFIGVPVNTQRGYTAEMTALYEGFAQHQIRVALGYQYTEIEYEAHQNWGPGVLDGSQTVVDGTLTDLTGTEFMFMPNVDRNIAYLSLQDSWAFARDWELTWGLRYDDYSDFGETVNPRAALVWQAAYNLTTKLLYGQAFRAPSFTNFYAQNNPVGLGNPSLDPETIDMLELAFDYLPSVGSRIKLSLFAYEIDGLIEFVPDPGGATARSQNARDQEGHGAEFEVEWQATETLKLQGNIAWQEARDKDTKIDIEDMPGLQAYINAHWRFRPDWSIDAQWFWVGNRKRASSDTRPDIDDYNLVNMTLRGKQVVDGIDMALAVRNLFDEDVREPSTSSVKNDYPMDGRALWVETRINF